MFSPGVPAVHRSSSRHRIGTTRRWRGSPDVVRVWEDHPWSWWTITILKLKHLQTIRMNTQKPAAEDASSGGSQWGCALWVFRSDAALWVLSFEATPWAQRKKLLLLGNPRLRNTRRMWKALMAIPNKGEKTVNVVDFNSKMSFVMTIQHLDVWAQQWRLEIGFSSLADWTLKWTSWMHDIALVWGCIDSLGCDWV